MSEFKIVQDYPQAITQVWAALTDPELIPLWTSTGRGGRPVGFAPIPATKFRLIGKPTIGWDGTVDCEVIEASPPRLLSFTWRNGEHGKTSLVSNQLDPIASGTRLTYEHTGFTGPGGLIMSRLLGSVRRKMLTVGLPPLLRDLDDYGKLKPTNNRTAEPPSFPDDRPDSIEQSA